MNARLRRLFSSWYVQAIVCGALLLAFAFWVVPRPVPRVLSVDGTQTWSAGQVPLRRQVLWEPARALAKLMPEGTAPGSCISPRLSDGGATLYFTHRPDNGHADIWRSRFLDGAWQPAEPIAALNSEADDIGPAPSRDGKSLYFYSNRPGGQGGFDLYVCQRTASGWGKPRNLGPQVNSPAHEYDPAISPDGCSLYFASNRVPGMAKQAAEKPDARQWSATLRAHPGQTRFDLYVARRPSDEEVWRDPQALADLNWPNRNQGAPCVSPSGTFLYFASDRPARPGEPPNLDLYRARITGERFADIENLGPGINTPAHETEPALSPEGFTLVFSSNRDGTDGLYQCVAHEVVERTDWDTSNWQAFAAVWWQVLLLTLLTTVLAAIVWYSQGWLIEKATAARFLAASFLLHCLLLLLMGYVNVGIAVLGEVREIRASLDASQIGESTSQPSFTPMADLRPPDPAMAELARTAPEREVMPERTETPLPTNPAEVPHIVPPNRIRSIPMREPVSLRPVEEMARLSRIDPTRLAEVQPVPAELTPSVPLPREKPAEPREITQARKPADVPALVPEQAPRAETRKPSLPLPVDLDPAGLKMPDIRATEPLLADRRPLAPVDPISKMEKAELTAPVSSLNARALEPVPASVSPIRRDPTDPPRGMAVAPPAIALQAAGPQPGMQEPPPAKLDSALPRLTPLNDPLVRSSIRPGNAGADLPRVAGNELPLASVEKPTEKPVKDVELSLPREASKPVEPLPVVPMQPAGAKPPIVMANLGDLPRGARPVLDPLSDELPRARAQPDRLALTDEKPTLFSLRKEKRPEAIKRFGGTPESEAAVERGLEWLAAHQSADGSWSLDGFCVNCKHPRCQGEGRVKTPTGATALALLPFLGAGYTHKATNKHQQTVARGLKWLIEQQRADGLLAAHDYRPMYGHGLAAIVLCEVYAMTRDAQLREPAQKALNFIVKAQHPTTGGWRYLPGDAGDTSVLGWQVMALRSGASAGLSVPENAFAGARRWLASVEANRPTGGQFGYQGAAPTLAMSAQGLLCLQLMGERRDGQRLVAGADHLLKHLPQRGSETSYYWYHATQVMYHLQGKHWAAWNEKMRDQLVATQIRQGSQTGSWEPRDARELTGGRIYATALRLLMLEVYYRHLPLYQQLEK